MIKYAILEIDGKQYLVSPGKPFEVAFKTDRLDPQILMLVDGKKVQIGNPYISAKLNLKVLENLKGKKIRVAKFRAKSNYRVVKGFKPQISKVVLES